MEKTRGERTLSIDVCVLSNNNEERVGERIERALNRQKRDPKQTKDHERPREGRQGDGKGTERGRGDLLLCGTSSWQGPSYIWHTNKRICVRGKSDRFGAGMRRRRRRGVVHSRGSLELCWEEEMNEKAKETVG